MSHPRALDEQIAIEAADWYRDYVRVGTFKAKATELGVTPKTLRETIQRTLNPPPPKEEVSTLLEQIHVEPTSSS